MVFGRFPLVFGLVSYCPGPVLESVFLWRVSVDRNLLVFKDAFYFGLVSPPSGGSGGGSGLSSLRGNRAFWAYSGPAPVGTYLFCFLALSAAGLWAFVSRSATGRTYGRILEFSFGASESVSRNNFR